MKNRAYYKSSAEKVFLFGLEDKDVETFAKYRKEKAFPDLREAIYQGRKNGIGTYEREVGCIADRIYGVIEIDTRSFDRIYGKPDEDI